MKNYQCPTCHKKLTKTEFEKALRVNETREKHFAHREEALAQRERQQRIDQRNKMRQLKQQGAAEKKRIRDSERARAARQQAGLRDQLEAAKEKLRQRAKGTTPQTEGLEFEEKLATRLRKEFPEDRIVEKGRGGDVLHTVIFNKKDVGVIIYECKRTPSIQSSHIAQTRRAKQSREADFAVLVTTGRKKGFSGFSQADGISVVSPLAAIPLVALLREHLIEMARLKITREKRGIIARQLMRYIDSPQFKNPIEEVAKRTSKLQEMIRKEAKDHVHIWKERWNHYETIGWNATQVQSNLRLVLHGSQPKSIAQHKGVPLELPLLKN